jgi:trk system potassium uptake protein TrkA
MHFIVVGCGRLGSNLASKLSQKGHQVVVLEEDPEQFKRLPAEFRGRMVQGEGLGQDVMRRAGVERADGLAAVTNSDALNAVLGHIARTVYNVPNVVVRNVDPAWLVYHEAFGSEVVSSAGWSAQRVEQLLMPSAGATVLSVDNGGVQVVRLEVPEHWWGKSLESAVPSAAGSVVIVSLTRNGAARVPEAATVLERGDVLHVAGAPEEIDAIRAKAAH